MSKNETLCNFFRVQPRVAWTIRLVKNHDVLVSISAWFSQTLPLNHSCSSTNNPTCKYCIDYESYSAILEPTGVCDDQLDLLLVITSSHRADAYNRRTTIRNTWGKLDNINYNINRLFVLGRSTGLYQQGCTPV